MKKGSHISPEHAAKVDAGRKRFWERVRNGEIPHPSKGKKFPRNGKQSHTSPLEKRVPVKEFILSTSKTSILDRIKVATLQLVEIDALPVKDIESTFDSIEECERALLILDQLAARLERLHVLVSYCKELQLSTLRRIRAHEKSTIPR